MVWFLLGIFRLGIFRCLRRTERPDDQPCLSHVGCRAGHCTDTARRRNVTDLLPLIEQGSDGRDPTEFTSWHGGDARGVTATPAA
jgi:hypothetical protein